MSTIQRKILRFVYRAVTFLIFKASQTNNVRSLVALFLRLLAFSVPRSAKNYAETKWLSDVAFIMHEALAGAWISKSHSFAHILGPSKAISFVFPYYKKREELINAIASLKKQKYSVLNPNEVEIIVVDDGSQELLDDILDPDVVYVRRNKFGYGISRSRNLGAKISSGRLLCFVDPDFVFPENYVETVYAEYLKYGEHTVISGYIYDYFYLGCEDPRVAFGVWEEPNIKTKRFLQLAGGHMAIDRRVFFNLGGFDEDLIYGEVEDTYFGYQLSMESEMHIVFSTNVTVRHIPHPSGLAHEKPADSFQIAALKSPDFFKAYVAEGSR